MTPGRGGPGGRTPPGPGGLGRGLAAVPAGLDVGGLGAPGRGGAGGRGPGGRAPGGAGRLFGPGGLGALVGAADLGSDPDSTFVGLAGVGVVGVAGLSPSIGLTSSPLPRSIKSLLRTFCASRAAS